MAVRNGIKKLMPLFVLTAVLISGVLYFRQKEKPRQLVLSGSLEARTVNVGSLVGGRVTGVAVDEGDTVTAGQVIATLETDTIDRQLAEQQAAIDAAEAQLAKVMAGSRAEEISTARALYENAERERRRLLSLVNQGIVSRSQYDSAATAARTAADQLHLARGGSRVEDIILARTQVKQQQRRLETLARQKKETSVHASAAGVVQSFALRPGDLVAPNQAVAEILEADQLWVRIYVPETLLGLVTVNQPVKITVDSFPGLQFEGRVASISSQGEYTPRNVQTRAQRAEQVFGVKVNVAPDPRLKAGMAADVDLGVKGHA